jgi:chemotaxis-related protein WspB
VTRRLSTRIVVVHHPGDTGGTRLLGLVAEKVTEVMRRDAAEFVEAGLIGDDQSHLGPVLTDPRGLVHRLDLSKLLAEPRHHTVSEPLVEHAWPGTTSKTS